jgi:hypothetical protein
MPVRIPHSVSVLLCVILVMVAVVLNSCKRSDHDRVPLARVDQTWLYLDEVTPSIPEGAKENDSIFAVRSFVDNWIRQQLVLKHAEDHLRDMKPSFERQLQDYRNALLIYSYEEELVRQKLDTVVTDQEVKAYYDANKEDFILKENIVKVLYVKLYRGEASLPQFRKLIQSDSQTDRLKLANLARQNAVNFFRDDEVWLYFNDLLKEVPIVTYNQEAWLSNSRVVEIRDSTFYFLLNVKDFRIADSYSPISMERDRIKYTIINKRKASIINNLSDELYERANRKKRFETYY